MIGCIRFEEIGFHGGRRRNHVPPSHWTHVVVFFPDFNEVMDFWHSFNEGKTEITKYDRGGRFCSTLGLWGEVHLTGTFRGTIQDLTSIMKRRFQTIQYSSKNNCATILPVLYEVLRERITTIFKHTHSLIRAAHHDNAHKHTQHTQCHTHHTSYCITPCY